MIVVNLARGYSGSYIIHWNDPEDGDSGCEWVHSKVIFEIFRHSNNYMESINEAWKLIPTRRSRPTRTVAMHENARGDLKEIINRLKERRDNGGLDKPAKGITQMVRQELPEQ